MSKITNYKCTGCCAHTAIVGIKGLIYPLSTVVDKNLVKMSNLFQCCSVLNYSTLDGLMFCKPHFLEAFRRKGMLS